MDFGRSICRSTSGRFRRVLNSRLRVQANSENDGVQTCQNHPHGLLFGLSFLCCYFLQTARANDRKFRKRAKKEKGPGKVNPRETPKLTGCLHIGKNSSAKSGILKIVRWKA
jgi:hypothetical protein